MVRAGFNRDLELGSDTVGRRHQDRIGVARALEVEQGAESADLGVRSRPRGGANQWLDQLHHAVAGIDVDAGLGIGEALVCHGVSFAAPRASVLGNPRLCNGLIAAILTNAWPRAPLVTARRGPSRGADLSIPNLITLGRILLVPVVVWAITAGEMQIAFVLFLAAGISDAVDGFLAKRFGMATELGAYLDPLADKAMLVSIYVALGITDAIPRWLVILVVSRDIMIVSAVILSWVVDKPVPLKPLLVSKLNTVAQIVLAGVVMAALGFDFDAECRHDAADGAGRGLDLAFRCLLCRRVGAPHERGGHGPLNRVSSYR